MSSHERMRLPDEGTPWPILSERMRELSASDVDWRNGRAAVYVFHAGEDVLSVAHEAYALFQSENGLGPLAFPSLQTMEEEVVSMGLGLLHGPSGACGNMTSGGTESILLAVKTCRDQAAATGADLERANIVVPFSAHPAFDKACHYFGLEIRRTRLRSDWTADPMAMAEALDAQTLMLVGSAPCFPYGLIDPIAELSELAQQRNLWLHVDACVGAYFAPFARMNGVPVPPFDFELSGVMSISGDLHKYGYAAKGASTLFHRSTEQRAFQGFECGDWPAGHMSTPTLAGTRPGGAIASAWAVMQYLGVSGYREKARQVCRARELIAGGINALPGLCTHGDPKLGILFYGAEDVDPYAIYGRMLKRGWFSGLVTDPRAIHLMLSPAHAGVADQYLSDLSISLQEVRAGKTSGPVGPARYS